MESRTTVHSDHQPLETIFKKPLSRAPRRLQRMMSRLQNYHFTVQYKKGKELFVADTLSRAALRDGSGMTQEHHVFRVDLTQMDLSPNLVKPGTMNQIREETVKDLCLMTLKKVVLAGWPSQKRVKYRMKSEPTVTSEMRFPYMLECSSNLMKS